MKTIDNEKLACVVGGVRMGPNGETCTDPRPTFPRRPPKLSGGDLP